MVVLDSDILIGFLRNDTNALKTMEDLEKNGEKLNTTVINAFEIFEGAVLSSEGKKIKQVEDLLRSLVGCYNFNGPASWKAAEISADLKKKGKVLDFQDICIASISIINNEKLITRNIKHFSRIKGLKIEKW